MLGAIIGDIVGSIYEFNNIKTTNFLLFSKNCEFTDDTVLTIAVLEALVNGYNDENKTKDELMKSFVKWTSMYPNMTYGNRFLKWIYSSDKKPYNSFGNGSAMRVSAVAWVYDNIDEVEKYAKISSEITHNHKEGIKGAVAVASSIFLARKGKSKQEIKEYIENKFGYTFINCDLIRPNYEMDETCMGSVPEAFSAFFEANSFEQTIRLAVSLGGDSDTIAAIAGSIAEAYYGIPDNIMNEAIKYLDDNIIKTLLDNINKIKFIN
ncbi:ADP-ribosylglycohydrolase family protein [Oceanivirga salmonicida]|uniref:ADP-ribosylglycohydrolase family protein n=1 Tax=Oceanivirga salmonicida TaxID=1769291 RepID=UPI0012E25E90|nr:ADP-ribosylglycohydrolase family protein [Oceanivirga salmonicida]